MVRTIGVFIAAAAAGAVVAPGAQAAPPVRQPAASPTFESSEVTQLVPATPGNAGAMQLAFVESGLAKGHLVHYTLTARVRGWYMSAWSTVVHPDGSLGRHRSRVKF